MNFLSVFSKKTLDYPFSLHLPHPSDPLLLHWITGHTILAFIAPLPYITLLGELLSDH